MNQKVHESAADIYTIYFELFTETDIAFHYKNRQAFQVKSEPCRAISMQSQYSKKGAQQHTYPEAPERMQKALLLEKQAFENRLSEHSASGKHGVISLAE